MGLPQTDVVTLPADPIQLIPTYDAALAAFEQLPPVRVLFDNGAGAVADADRERRATRIAGFEQDFSSFPVPGTTARTWYLGPARRARRRTPPTTAGVNAFTAERARASRSPTSAATPAPAGCGATRRSGSGTGSRTRRAPRSPTSPRRSPRTRRSSAAARSTSG